MIRFDGQVAVITGGARGQGEAEARLFAELGAQVVIADLDLEPANDVARSIGDQALAVEIDVASEQSWNALLAQATERFGGVDVLVNNAAVFKAMPLLDAPIEDVRLTIDVNLMGTYLGLRTIGRHMRERGYGSIVNIASTGALAPGENSTIYGMTKSALLALTRGAAVELGPTIRVNTVLPGGVATRMMPEDARPYFDAIPLGRLGEPEELANAVVFLASKAASYITGTELLVDGGWLLGDLQTRRQYVQQGALAARQDAAS